MATPGRRAGHVVSEMFNPPVSSLRTPPAMIFRCRHLSLSIQRSAGEVYAFVADPAHLPRWAHGLGQSCRPLGDAWEFDSPMGQVKVRFAARNELGVVDHDVTLPGGDVVHNPLRVLPNGDGAEVVFSLFHLPGVSDEEFARDAGMVEADLARLKKLLEA